MFIRLMVSRERSGMKGWRLAILASVVAALTWLGSGAAQAGTLKPEEVLRKWFELSLKLVRHTPTYSPPVASRSFAYLSIAAYEAAASGAPDLQSLAGQLNGLKPLPQREAGKAYDEAVVMDAVLASGVERFFANTGPTGQHVMQVFSAKQRAAVSDGVAPDVVSRSVAYGEAVTAFVLDWSMDDGGAVIDNMGFPLDYALTPGPAHWVPTSLIRQQQAPLLPGWGKNRTFAMPGGATCKLPPPPEYSEDKASAFYGQALEVYQTSKTLTPEQRDIARFWSDDPMLSPTPPGHWVSIALQILDRDRAGLSQSIDVLARLNVAMADAFIGCWQAKFEYDLLRPLTYIRRFIDPKWEALLITPPFPEYPSGHSSESGAAATVLTALFGEDFAFDDHTHERDGLKPRHFSGFWAAANEAGLSRLYGGIHFRAAIDRGLDQGRCVAAFALALKTRR
jgi:hypothetical protein